MMSDGDSLAPVERVTVPLDGRAYDIFIGRRLLDRAGTLLGSRLQGRRVFIVTDETVVDIHLAPLRAGLGEWVGAVADPVVVPAGESAKTFSELETVLNRLIDGGIERGDLVIALGGGVVGDLAGLAASLVLRGVPYLQIPTTLLAQVDSSVGGKTAVDMAQGKNLVGSFHQPVAVLADLDTLDSLDVRQLRAGYAEVVKYGLIDRAGFFDWLEDNGRNILSGDTDARALAVRTACEAKAEIVADDERESGRRALLNLGHSFAHALEAVAGYDDRILHGEAVAIGLVLAAQLSARLGMTGSDTADRIAAHLAGCGFDLQARAWMTESGVDALMTAMDRDKKVRGGRLRLVLLRGIGQAVIVDDVDRDAIAAIWSGYLQAEPAAGHRPSLTEPTDTNNR